MPATNNKPLGSSLSVVTEATESFNRTLSATRSVQDLASSSESKESTLKASSHSAFETDSLDSDVAKATMKLPSQTARQASGNPLPPAVDPTPDHALPPANLVISHAIQGLATPLSPIWNQMQYLRTDSETSNTDYITSYIGRSTPLPRLHVPDHTGKHVSGDSGQGESSDDVSGDSGSSEDSDSLEDTAEEVRGLYICRYCRWEWLSAACCRWEWLTMGAAVPTGG